MWQAILAGSVALVLIVGFVWIKLKQSANAETDTALREAQKESEDKARKTLEQQIAQKAETERLALEHEKAEILAHSNEAERIALARDMLKRVRGVD